jgi:precorrin-2/cobalt-factor-2 C20-methyltransferase
MTGKFYGIGLGPGDPGLLTLKAKEVLETVDVICSPISKEGRRSIALGIVEKVLDRMPEVITPLFPMSRDRAVLEEHWARAAGERTWPSLPSGTPPSTPLSPTS